MISFECAPSWYWDSIGVAKQKFAAEFRQSCIQISIVIELICLTTGFLSVLQSDLAFLCFFSYEGFGLVPPRFVYIFPPFLINFQSLAAKRKGKKKQCFYQISFYFICKTPFNVCIAPVADFMCLYICINKFLCTYMRKSIR